MRLVLAMLLGLARAAGSAEPPLEATARALVGADQGVFVQAEDGTVLAAVEADRPVHPASVTKVASSLALLRQLGPTHRFETQLRSAGAVRNGVLDGDLVVASGGDPYLVDESALAMLLALHERGIRAVRGGLRVSGPELLFDWQPDPAGAAIRRVLAGQGGRSAWPEVRAAHDGGGLDLGAVALSFADRATPARDHPDAVLVAYRSPPLLRIVKGLNCWSNNVFHLVSARIGGPPAVERIARASVPPDLRPAIVIENGAGAGTTNRLSPRAAVALLDALGRALAEFGAELTDALPVSGVDPGTLRERFLGGYVVGKTGTFGSVGASALAGVLRTSRHGRVTFAILNRDVPVPEARRRQDAFVGALMAATGASPWPYRARGLPTFREAELRAAD